MLKSKKTIRTILALIGLLIKSSYSTDIGFLSSWKIRCGIASYTEHHCNALKKLGYSVKVYSHDLKPKDLLTSIKKDEIKILHIQYEQGFWPKLSTEDFVKTVEKIKKTGVKIITTMHSEPPKSYKINLISDWSIYHKEPLLKRKLDVSKISILPHGVPVFDSSLSKDDLRKKYNFKNTDTILTTFGFMSSWKMHPEILRLMVPIIKNDPNLKIQLLTSINDFDIIGSLNQSSKIKDIIRTFKIENQIIHITDFLSEKEIQERLYLSDLGFLWAGDNTTSSSGALKQFISARLPVVTTKSSHYLENMSLAIETPMIMDSFIATINESLYNNNIHRTKENVEKFYRKYNYDTLIISHIEIYKKICNDL